MKKIYSVLALLFLVSLSSCDVLQQAAELTAFTKCKFNLHTVDGVRLAGVNVEKIKNYSDLNFMDIAQLTTAVTSGKLPLNFTLNVKVNNPNSKLAAMNRFDWILYIDDIEMTQGVLEERIEIPSTGETVLPIKMNMNLKEVLKGKTLKSLVNFGLNLADASKKPSRITLKAKPTIMIGGRPLTYPDYISIKSDI